MFMQTNHYDEKHTLFYYVYIHVARNFPSQQSVRGPNAVVNIVLENKQIATQVSV